MKNIKAFDEYFSKEVNEASRWKGKEIYPNWVKPSDIKGFVKKEDDLEVGKDYVFYEPGMDSWQAEYTYKGKIKGEYTFTSSAQFSTSPDERFTRKELDTMIKDLELAVMESVNEENILNEEGKLTNVEMVKVTHEIDYYIEDTLWKEFYSSEKEHAEMIATDLSLKSGEILFEADYFKVYGKSNSGLVISISQGGEYNKYGGPYTPKMSEPKANVQGKSIVNKIKAAYKAYGWDSDGTAIDISRTDIWGHLIK